MESNHIIALLLLLIFVSITLFVVYYLKNKRNTLPELDYNNIIQKNTFTLFFTSEGILQSTSSNTKGTNLLSSLKIGNHISDYKKFKSINKYFESCKKNKKNISIKLIEDRQADIAHRHDLIFSPLLENNQVNGVFIISQELHFKNTDKKHISQKKELEQERNFALKQIDDIEAEKSELELAFKKSSKHHIMLQKAMRQIENQKSDLESALIIIKEQKLKLEIANKEIRKSSKMKEIFLANTSHEIRTPLNAIIGFTNLLNNSSLNDSQRRYIENIKASGNNLLVVINDILDFSKIESGKLSIEQVEFDFMNLINHTINTLQIKSQEKQIEIKYDISDEIPDIITGDPVRLNQILINLLGNAIKFTNKNGLVRLVATLGKAKDGFVKIIFKVEDNGIGISQNKLNQIFQSFTQGESDTTRKYGGTGLGLSIVKQLIKLQNGEITVDSRIDKGTAFTFYIILKRSDKNTNTLIKHTQKNIESSNADNMRILLVEDNIINQQLAYDTIKSWNINIVVDIAENGKIALSKIEQNNYSLVLMDIQMPVMDGNEATLRIRNLRPPKNKIPIIAMTAHALKNEKENYLNNGMDDYISKPFDPKELFVKILKYAHNKSTNEQTYIENETITQKDSTDYKYFHLINLKKIYPNSNDKIVKIVSMCYDSIPKEIIEIKEAYKNEQWDILKNKAHSLKPKLGYLGMEKIQQSAKNIELCANKEDERLTIKNLISDINDHWELAAPKLLEFINT